MAEHLLRGVIGVVAVALAARVGARNDIAHVAASLALGVTALIALRGCPICWTTGLIGMIARRRAGESQVTP